jgi:hypothetical protein
LATFTASPYYVWDREVNVVYIGLDPNEGSNNKVTMSGASVTAQSYPGLMIASNAGGEAFDGNLRVLKVDGPTRSGQKGLGISNIKIGFIQTAEMVARNGTYGNGTRRIRSAMQDGLVHLDAATNGTLPWYAGSDALYVGLQAASDHPVFAATNAWIVQHPLANLVRANLDFKCNMYLALATKDTDNNANAVFVGRATAAWEFNGSGTYEAKKWYPMFPLTRVSGPKSFTLINGNLISWTGNETINVMLKNSSWVQEQSAHGVWVKEQ